MLTEHKLLGSSPVSGKGPPRSTDAVSLDGKGLWGTDGTLELVKKK